MLLHLLLRVDCLETARVTQATRDWIENTMLLPIDEIRRREAERR